MRGEKGYVLALTGLLLVPLVVFTAFGVDLGAWYAQAAKAAAGGRRRRRWPAWFSSRPVPTPSTAATAASRANGYNCLARPPRRPGPTQRRPSRARTRSRRRPARRCRSALYSSATQYFSGVGAEGRVAHPNGHRGLQPAHPARQPEQRLRQRPAQRLHQPDSTTSPCPNPNTQPNLCAAIQGPFTATRTATPTPPCARPTPRPRRRVTPMGFAHHRWRADLRPATTARTASYDPNGYIWAVDVKQANVPRHGADLRPGHRQHGRPPDERHLRLQRRHLQHLLRAVQHHGLVGQRPRDAGAVHAGPVHLGDPGWANFTSGTSAVPSSGNGYTGQAPYYTEAWYTPVHLHAHPDRHLPAAGQDQRHHHGTVADSGTGWNVYSVQGHGTARRTQPQVYALNDMSIWTPPARARPPPSTWPASAPQYAGHTLVVDLYDPGDGTRPRPVHHAVPAAPVGPGHRRPPRRGTPSRATTTPHPARPVGAATPNSRRQLQHQTPKLAESAVGIYNGNWLSVSITIPGTYTCTTDCWWSIKYNFGHRQLTPTDRTIWVVNVLGDPVHLIQ